MGMLGDTKARRPFELPGCTVVGEPIAGKYCALLGHIMQGH